MRTSLEKTFPLMFHIMKGRMWGGRIEPPYWEPHVARQCALAARLPFCVLCELVW
jgi:hypothetical protein